ncbi:unnamed protein product [Clonostachys rosea]|uniref:Uncharacterized protein n=1 Tax=Bionectria ochroleuca TaxID=29856 RepID=A0ABY6UEN7_BIOOC|nr:unnamed protein product [Clonostachys rosea]
MELELELEQVRLRQHSWLCFLVRLAHEHLCLLLLKLGLHVPFHLARWQLSLSLLGLGLRAYLDLGFLLELEQFPRVRVRVRSQRPRRPPEARRLGPVYSSPDSKSSAVSKSLWCWYSALSSDASARRLERAAVRGCGPAVAVDGPGAPPWASASCVESPLSRLSTS